MTTLFIDVSHHDWNRRGGAIDWSAVAGAGMGRVMCARASYGDPAVYSPASPHFGDYMAGARAAGYDCRGGYHNLIRGDQASINRQVDLLRSTMDRHGTEWAMADVEAYAELVTRNLVPRWEDVQRFHDRWYTVESRTMAWYIGRGFWSGNLGSPNLTGLRGPLIVPRYPGVTGAPASAYTAAGGDAGNGWAPVGGRVADMWQYTSKAAVPGASDQTDVNAYRGTVDQLAARLTGTHPQKEDDMLYLVDILVSGTAPNQVNLTGLTTGAGDFHHIAKMEALDWVKANASPKDLGRMWDWEAFDRFGIGAPKVVDPAELTAIGQAAGAAVAAQIPALVDALMTKLPADAMSRQDVLDAVGSVLGRGLVLGPTPTP